jgi:hypothetical protein
MTGLKTINLLSAFVFVLGVAQADALVVCKRRNGDIRIRETCRKKELALRADQIGLVGAQGTQGPPGPQGAQGPAGPATDLACAPGAGTNLLFPFVTNQAGFDTAIAIANTSKDPFGTEATDGKCDVHFFGANAPSTFTSPTIAAGTDYTFLASSTAPNFQGYVFAVCDFRYAHGFAFVSDLGARNLAMGYLPLVTCADRSPAHPEQLLH